MARGFLSGLVLGTATAALGLGALSLALPAPRDDATGPGGADVTIAGPEQGGSDAATSSAAPDAGSGDRTTDAGAEPSAGMAGDPSRDDSAATMAADEEFSGTEGPQGDRAPSDLGGARMVPPSDGMELGAATSGMQTGGDRESAEGDRRASQGDAGLVLDDAMPGMEMPGTERPFDDRLEAMDAAPDRPAPAGSAQDGSRPGSDVLAGDDRATADRSDEGGAASGGDMRSAGAQASDDGDAVSADADTTSDMQADDTARAATDPPADPGGGAGAREIADGSAQTEAAVGSASDGSDGEMAGTPLDRFAAAWDGPDDRPLMSIVLLDDGTSPMGPDAITAFPFPVSFAVSPDHPRAAEVAQAYRDKGFEVLTLVGSGGDPDGVDVETLLFNALDAVPGAVAVLEAPNDTLPDSRRASGRAASFLEASGHGLVSAPRASNTPQQIAAQAGVPSVVLFRDIDGDGQESPAIRRTLDQGSARAAQEGSAVMLGRVSATTITAVVLWGLQDRGQTLSLAPVSAILRARRDDAG